MHEWDGIERRSGVRRRTRRVYRFMDRRHGFDRRRRYPVLGTMRDHPWLLVAVLVAMNLLSLIDGFFTAVELTMGIATEGNPVLNAAARQHPLLAVIVKVGTLLVVSVGIWHGRRTRIMLALSLCALTLFAAVVAFHAGSLRGLGLL